MTKYRCPTCGNAGEHTFGDPASPFERRGQVQGRPVYMCRECGAGLVRLGAFSKKLTAFPDEQWERMKRKWDARYEV